MVLGSGIRKKPIPGPGSMGQKRHRIPDPDPQHWGGGIIFVHGDYYLASRRPEEGEESSLCFHGT